MKQVLKFLPVLFIGLLIAPTGCDDKAPSNHEPTTWCVLLDMSGVREDPAMRSSYADNFKRIMKYMEGGDMLAVAFITEASANELSLLVEHRFPLFEPGSTNRDRERKDRKKYERELKRMNDSILNRVLEVIANSNRVAPMTEIISAVHVAAALLHKGDTKAKKLILFSDMEEYSNDYKFTKEKLDDKRISKIIEAEKAKARRLPDLKGVKVIVAGAQSKNSERFFDIRNFWVQYFTACGAMLHEDDYGAALTGL